MKKTVWIILIFCYFHHLEAIGSFSGIYYDNGKPIFNDAHRSGKKDQKFYLDFFSFFFNFSLVSAQYLCFAGLGQTISEPLEAETDLKKLREEILNLLGMKHVPNSESPHFVSHLEGASSSTVRNCFGKVR